MPSPEQGTYAYLPDDFYGFSPIFWKATDQRVYIGCSDDRAPTPGSAAQLDEFAHGQNVLAIQEGYASTFGGLPGIAHDLLAAGVARHGVKFIETTGGFDSVVSEIHETVGGLAVVHSDVLTEGEGAVAFCAHGNVGCAYCNLVGATAYYLDEQAALPDDAPTIDLLISVARQDQEHFFGENNSMANDLLAAKSAIAQHFAKLANGSAKDFSFDRERIANLIEQGGRAMILSGNHADPKTSGLIFNFDSATIGNPTAIAEASTPAFYRSDVARVAHSIAPLLAKYDIPPELYLRAIVLGATPVRAALVVASSSGQFDPRPLAIGIRGSVHNAIQNLSKTVAQLKQERTD